MEWNPVSYGRFADHRLRPAQDLLAQVPDLPAGDVIDLGCGAGAVGAALRTRFGGQRRLIGIDAAASMLDQARATGLYDRLDLGDIRDWEPETPPALIFSNAALHWLQNHDDLLPRLLSLLPPSGCLAVQVPHQNRAPSHHIWRCLVDEFYPGRVDHAAGPDILDPLSYHRLLAPRGEVRLWQTEYYQLLEACDAGHPVRRFTESTFARPILEALAPQEQARLIEAYDEAINSAYPRQGDGQVLLPFRRLFFVVTRG